MFQALAISNGIDGIDAWRPEVGGEKADLRKRKSRLFTKTLPKFGLLTL
jgi:hypothetical protein